MEAVSKQNNVVAAVARAGGIYIILSVVFGFLFSLFVPYFMHLFVIRTLFKVDTNKVKAPQSEE